MDDMMKVSEDGKSVIGRHFKPTTSPEEIKSILKLLPAVLTGALVVGQESEEQTNLAYGGRIRPIKNMKPIKKKHLAIKGDQGKLSVMRPLILILHRCPSSRWFRN